MKLIKNNNNIRLLKFKNILLLITVLVLCISLYNTTSTNTHTNTSTNTQTKTNTNTNTNTHVHTNNKLKTSLKNQNKIKNANTNQMKSKTSIFESFKAWNTKSGSKSNNKSNTKSKSKNKSKLKTKQGGEEEEEAGGLNSFMDRHSDSNGSNSQPSNPNTPNPNQQVLKGDRIDNLFGRENAFDTDGEIDIGNGPTWFEGWLKFFRFVFDDKAKRPQAFYKNPKYDSLQHSYNATQLKQQEGKHFKYPQTELSFFASLMKDELNFYTNNGDKIQSMFDVLNLDYITPVPEENSFYGGITDFGSFKEGECFKVKTNQSGNWIWIICTDKPETKVKLMATIKKLVIQKQRNAGFINTKDNVEKQKRERQEAVKKDSLTGAELDQDTYGVMNKDKVSDGYWIRLQEWSSCTKKCGGGTQTLHRMCVPPKQGGNPCEGKAVITKSCNTDPCPNVKEAKEDVKEAQEEELKPKINIMPFSSRPQRYDKCHLKESDLLMSTELDKNAKLAVSDTTGKKINVVQMPVRVVMNENTLAAYAGTNYTKIQFSVDIQKARFLKSGRDKVCFIIQERANYSQAKGRNNSKSLNIELCPFGLDNSETTKQEWDYDFNLFKYQCHSDKKLKAAEDDPEIAKALKDKKNQMKMDIISKKPHGIIHEQSDEDLMNTEQKRTNLQAIQKELKLEKMIEEEEKERARDIEKEKITEVDKEKAKFDCLNQAIKEKEIENQYNIKKLEKKEDLSDLKMDAVQEIIVKRANLKNKIKQIRAQVNKKSEMYDQEIQNIRLEIKNETKPPKETNPDKCRDMAEIAYDNEDKYKELGAQYCREKFITDATLLEECQGFVKSLDIVGMNQLCCDSETSSTDSASFEKCINNIKSATEKPDLKDVAFFWGRQYYKKAGFKDELEKEEEGEANKKVSDADKKANEAINPKPKPKTDNPLDDDNDDTVKLNNSRRRRI